jgi:hypothetical protein
MFMVIIQDSLVMFAILEDEGGTEHTKEVRACSLWCVDEEEEGEVVPTED